MITAEQARQWEADIANWRHRVEAMRIQTIEECAKVAETYDVASMIAAGLAGIPLEIAAAIRAKKDKP